MPIGDSNFVLELASQFAANTGLPLRAGGVSHFDLFLGCAHIVGGDVYQFDANSDTVEAIPNFQAGC